MAITKQQRIYVAVLGLAAAAWGTDRFILHGGVTAPAAADASSLLITRAALPGLASPLTDQGAPVLTLAERLDHFSSQAGEASSSAVRDVFAPPASWIPVEKATEGPVAASENLGQALAEFRQSHALTAVIRAGRNSQIFLGARIVRLGERVDGFQLAAVTASSATFDYHGGEVILELADPLSRKAN